MKWSTEAKVGAFALAGILLFAGILIELSSLVIFGKSGFHVTGYFKEAEGIEPGNPIHYAGVEVGMVDGIMQLVEFALDCPEVPTVIFSGKILKHAGTGIGNRLGNLPP